MANKARGGLSKREFEAKSKGQPMPYSSAKTTTSKSGSGNSKMSSQLKAANKAYEKSLKPTKEEDAAEKELNKVVTEGVMSRNKITNEPIAQPFQTGQIRETERRVEEKTVPLKLQIATLQARRQASSNVSQARLNSIKDLITSKTKSNSLEDDPEYQDLKKQELRASVAKKTKTGGGGSSASDWVKITVEKGPTGRVRSIIERNKKTGETRRTAVK